MIRRLIARSLIAAPLALAAPPAHAEEQEFCAQRPGQTTPTCVQAPGTVMAEFGIASWERQQAGGQRDDGFSFGDLALRTGLTDNLEAEFGWQAVGVAKSKDLVTHTSQSATRVGDAWVGLLYGFAGANGPVALQVYATLPTGKSPIGAGDWGAGARLPIALPLGGDWELGLTPEVSAAVNSSGNGRHLAYGGAVGIGHPLSDSLSLGVDLSVFRDEDMAGKSTQAVTTASLAWQVDPDTQIDFGGGTGLNRDSIDAQLYLGVSRRF